MPDNGQQIQQPQINTEAPQPPVSFEAAATQPPPSTGGGVREAFAARGYDVQNFQDDQQFIETIESGLTQLNDLPELQQLAEYGKQFLREQSQGGQAQSRSPRLLRNRTQTSTKAQQPTGNHRSSIRSGTTYSLLMLRPDSTFLSTSM